MANANKGNVHILDTDGAFTEGRAYVQSIKYIGASNGTATIKTGGSGGTVVWEESGSANTFNEVNIVGEDLYFTTTNSAKIYVYLAARR